LNASRAELDRARSENTAERRTIVSRRDYATPDAVPAGLGLGGLTGRGKWATAAGALAFLAIVALLLVVLVQAARADPLAVHGDVVERIGDDCSWHVSVPLINNGDQPLVVARLELLIDRRPVVMWKDLRPLDVLPPGATTEITFERRVSPCPLTPDDVEHGELRAIWLTADAPGVQRLNLNLNRNVGQMMRYRF